MSDYTFSGYNRAEMCRIYQGPEDAYEAGMALGEAIDEVDRLRAIVKKLSNPKEPEWLRKLEKIRKDNEWLHEWNVDPEMEDIET